MSDEAIFNEIEDGFNEVDMFQDKVAEDSI